MEIRLENIGNKVIPVIKEELTHKNNYFFGIPLQDVKVIFKTMKK